MADQPLNELPVELVDYLQGSRLVLAVVTDAESGAPNVHAVSWAIAQDARTVQLAVDNRARLARNLKAAGQILLVVVGAGGCWSISGRAAVAEEQMKDTPLQLARFSITVETVRDVMFFGAELDQAPTYTVTYNPAAAARLDQQVYAALRREPQPAQ